MIHRPVFVAGQERSGTSLMFALLTSHPNIAMTRRTNLWRYFYGQFGDLRDDQSLDTCLDKMMRYKRLVVLQPNAEELRREFLTGERTYGRLFALLEQQYADRLGKPRWGDKSLDTERFAGPLFDAYPDARIIHMVRDPRDRYASVETRWKVRRGGVGAGTAEWLSSVELAERNCNRYGDKYLILRYETLVRSPEEVLRDICEFIDERYAPEMLTMSGARSFRDQGSNSSYGSRDRGVISTDSVGRYREVLSPSQTRFIQHAARRPMETLGYEADERSLGPLRAARFALGDLPLEYSRMAAWRARASMHDRRGRALPAYRLVSPVGTA
ncbi:MAG TPA: sulfotransferase [Acidimicrobiales bacterium]|nr:sulfotransferase [Acidimicrobiales bacterium]